MRSFQIAIEGEKLAPFNLLPNELLFFIFRHVVTNDISTSLQHLKNCTLVCWRWKEIIGVPKLCQQIVNVLNNFIPEIAFGKAEWENYFGEVGVEPSLPGNIHTILESSCPFWPDKKVKETHWLVLVPKTMNGQPLTLEYMGQLVQSLNLLQGYETQYSIFSPCGHEKIKVEQSRWVLMTRDVIPNSRNKSYGQQQQLAANYPNYEIVTLLEATICIFLDYVQSGTIDNLCSYTHCQEKGGLYGQMLVGFCSSGLVVFRSGDYDYVDCSGISVFRIMP